VSQRQNISDNFQTNSGSGTALHFRPDPLMCGFLFIFLTIFSFSFGQFHFITFKFGLINQLIHKYFKKQFRLKRPSIDQFIINDNY